ncbi:MAG: N-acetylglucosamine kinase [Bacteroidetes bacterium]|jgi:N-acetylglucosamine kinase-like BadF-type ATPase|nr:N-acetylglucosamine kinase [Bacteroidota bacterium]
MNNYIIADSGATKCQWTIVQNNKRQSISTMGISPYFLSTENIAAILEKAFSKKVKTDKINAIYFYGTGLSNPDNVKSLKKALRLVFKNAKLDIQTDLVAAARATCQTEKGIACILGTGSNTGYYNGKKIVKNSPGLGYVLGDEGSGAYLGKKVLQYFLYQTFDEELMICFSKKYNLDRSQILNKIYREPLPNRYLASFAVFLSEHRGHYMIENIIEDGLNDFFYTHLNKLNESWLYPIHFTGSVAYAFRDVIKQLALVYEMELGKITKSPMEGLVAYHKNNP